VEQDDDCKEKIMWQLPRLTRTFPFRVPTSVYKFEPDRSRLACSEILMNKIN